ncbi:MAG: hypothetical protein HC912_11780 [Saprospiraceae bacterium]|nr:hypothetical protein [Saprospiraceae bacterium]
MVGFLFPLIFSTFFSFAQQDTTIYVVAEEMPRFPSRVCESLDTTVQAKYQCSQQALLAFMYSNIEYPFQARMNNIEGNVVTSFVVEPDSTISNIQLLKDVGGDCGPTVIGLLGIFNEIGVRWIPGKEKGKAVRTRLTLPIRFRLKEAPPYVFLNGDTVYVEIDAAPVFKGGNEALVNYVNDNLNYPESYKDTCLIGYMDVQLLIEPNGVVKTMDVTDYCALGIDFQLEILDLTTAMFGKWQPATYQQREVPASMDIRLFFSPTNQVLCKDVVANFEQVNSLFTEGINLYNEGKKEEALEKMSKAIMQFPDNADFLATRGQIFMQEEKYAEACQDLTQAKQILGTNSYDQLLLILCNANKNNGCTIRSFIFL